ncbi:NADPH:quinone reductase-like Zn-dependent oxidoreductase [Saccharothrix tamanrassetensis]|uniref:NADPH:quinone reductase-like Zn-dependent oxidoreductase n=1 Tax=Saccharothrix tamanrassetensis TaxID=1051531 RepID=A0A841CS74_9PSEU|nr:NAD(P)-dependent alcohol dehydrogenase [Saccharothrix tamanrassetensis]MBB5960621.1 NADPH:quinone reductase-like Zn-dependent oxidoreductase [Saccharothrix tamanrassetensis]
MSSTSMRLATFDRYGPPEVLSVTTGPVPRPRPGEVLVRVRAVSVNGGELALRAGRLRPFSGRRFPKWVGIDLVGEVVTASGRFAAGDLVWGLCGRRMGSAAEYAAVRADRLDHVPAGLDAVQAAALPTGTTAITALRDVAALAPGERLLVRGATGGVGYVAVQLGKAMGAHVTGLAGAHNLDLAKDLGADDVRDYRAPGDLGRFDVVLDTVGIDLPAFRRLLTPRGRVVTIAFDLDHPVRSLAYIAAHATHRRRWVRAFSGNPTAPLFAELGRWVTSGAVRPQVDRVFPLEQIAGAHRALEQGGVRGKVVVRID